MKIRHAALAVLALTVIGGGQLASSADAARAGSSGIPDPCTLLSKSDVAGLTGRPVTRIDEDGVAGADVTRFCQWQQEGGRLAVFLSPTTPAGFEVTIDQAEWISGLGDDAYTHSGHLYVRDGDVQLDVYSYGAADDEQNLIDAAEVVETLIPKV